MSVIIVVCLYITYFIQTSIRYNMYNVVGEKCAHKHCPTGTYSGGCGEGSHSSTSQSSVLEPSSNNITEVGLILAILLFLNDATV